MNKTFVFLLLLAGCRTSALSLGSSSVPDGGVSDAAIADATMAVTCTSQTEDPAACSAQPGCAQIECPGCWGTDYLFCAPAGSSQNVCPLFGCPIEMDCKTLPDLVGNFIMGNDECTTADDCAFVSTACGLPGVCGAYINKNVTSDLQSYVDEWNGQSCANDCMQPPCSPPMPPQCVGGHCQ